MERGLTLGQRKAGILLVKGIVGHLICIERIQFYHRVWIWYM